MKEQWDEPQIIFTHQIQKSIFKTPLSIGVTKFWVICLVVNTNFSSLCKVTHRLITDVIRKTFSLLRCRCFFSHYVVCWFWQKSVTACFLLVSRKSYCLHNALRGYIKPKIVNTCYLIASIDIQIRQIYIYIYMKAPWPKRAFYCPRYRHATWNISQCDAIVTSSLLFCDDLQESVLLYSLCNTRN